MVGVVALTAAACTQRVERLGRGGGLGDASRRALAAPQDVALDADLDAEQLLVVRPGRIEDAVRGPSTRRPLGVLLEPALGALERPDGRIVLELRASERHEPVAGDGPAEIEVH